jgi:magnesium transporter
MIKVHEGVVGKLKGVSGKKKTKHCWIDVLDPTENEIDEICKTNGLHREDVIESLDEEESPRIEKEEKYIMIIFRTPFVVKEYTNGEDEEITTSTLGIFITKNAVITIHREPILSLSDLHFKVKKGRISLGRDKFRFVFEIMLQIIKRYFKILDKAEMEIERLEKDVLDSFDPKIMERILEMKKTLILFNKSISRNRDLLLVLRKDKKIRMSEETREFLDDVIVESTQLLDMASTYRDLLTNTLDAYGTAISNNLNIVMQILTVLSIILMVPTLVASIYGMNINLPFSEDPNAFFILSLIMVVPSLIAFLIFKKKRWL